MDFQDLSCSPSGGLFKQRLVGFGVAIAVIVYGIACLHRGHTTMFFGRQSFGENFVYDAGRWLAVSYIALGAFLHFHFFWGLSDRLLRFSEVGKVLSLLVFLPSFWYALVVQWF